MSCVIGFDYGAKRIGVAVGNRLTRSGQAIGVIANNSKGPDWQHCDRLFADWRPDTVLVGLPLTMQGEEQATSRAARQFAKLLEDRYQLPLQLVDERLSSIAASQRFAEQRASGQARRKHAATLDALAACIIVETWLATQ